MAFPNQESDLTEILYFILFAFVTFVVAIIRLTWTRCIKCSTSLIDATERIPTFRDEAATCTIGAPTYVVAGLPNTHTFTIVIAPSAENATARWLYAGLGGRWLWGRGGRGGRFGN